MFQTLLADIRAAVVSRIFLYRPRTATVAAETEATTQEPAGGTQPAGGPAQGSRSEKKRKRHRH
jgi:hypothetical protein